MSFGPVTTKGGPIPLTRQLRIVFGATPMARAASSSVNDGSRGAGSGGPVTISLLQDLERMRFSETPSNGASKGSATTTIMAVLRFSGAWKERQKMTQVRLFRPW